MDNFCAQCGNPLNGKNKCNKCGHISSNTVVNYDCQAEMKKIKSNSYYCFLSNHKKITFIALLLLLISVICIVIGTGFGTNKNTISDNQATEKTGIYYNTLKEEDKSVVFNFTLDDFLQRYNSIKAEYEDQSNRGIVKLDIDKSDFELFRKEDLNGKTLGLYGCKSMLAINNNDVFVALKLYDDKNTIHDLAIGVMKETRKKYYSDDYYGLLMTNYKVMISAATGCSMDNANELVTEMLGTENQFIYNKGIALWYDTSDSDVDWYRIIPCSKKEAEDMILNAGKGKNNSAASIKIKPDEIIENYNNVIDLSLMFLNSKGIERISDSVAYSYSTTDNGLRVGIYTDKISGNAKMVSVTADTAFLERCDMSFAALCHYFTYASGACTDADTFKEIWNEIKSKPNELISRSNVSYKYKTYDKLKDRNTFEIHFDN